MRSVRERRRHRWAAASAVLMGCSGLHGRFPTTATATPVTHGAVAPPLLSSKNPHRKRWMQQSVAADYILQRCGGSQGGDPTVWVYTGSLRDPLTGEEIATVEGVELVQGLAVYEQEEGDDNVVSKSDRARFRRRCRNLQVANVMASADKTDYCTTMLSRKLFCYTSPITGKLLEQLQKRPGGSLTRIPMDQAVTVYDTAVSCIASSENHPWLLHTEWPTGKAVWSTAVLRNMKNDNDLQMTAAPSYESSKQNIEFSVFSRLQNKPLRAEDLISLRTTRTTAAARTSPARSALIQFGASNTNATSKFGARETYQYYADDNDTLRCTRYGEAPVWYGPARMCQLELTGRRLTSAADIEQLVPVAAHLVEHHVPTFWRFGSRHRRHQWLGCDSSSSSSKYNTNENVDDPVFRYYADSLHAALRTDVDGSFQTNVDSSANDVDACMSCSGYRRYYEDLAVGRMVDRFRAQQPFESLTYSTGSRLHKWHETAKSCWGRITAATSVSIGGNNDR